MSLINDALKRANQTQKEGAPPISPGVGLKPVPTSGHSSGGLSKVFAFLLVAGVLSGAGWFLWQGLRSRGNATPTAVASTSNASSGVPIPKESDALRTTAREGQVRTTSTLQVNTNIVIRPGPISSVDTTMAAESAKRVSAGTTVAPSAREPSRPRTQALASATEPALPLVASSTLKPSGSAGTWPELRLQGVFYRLHKPSVRLNGKILYVGDEVEGARLVEIHRESVKLEFAGQTKVLPLKQ